MSGSDFAQIAICAVEHSSFEKSGGTKLLGFKANVETLLEADQAGVVIGANGRALIREQMHNMLKVNAERAPDVVVAAITKNATHDALQALMQGMLDKFPDMFCNFHQKEGRRLVLKGIKMLDLGEANLAKRFLQAVQGVNETIHECFCNYILTEYVMNRTGAGPVLVSSLRKFSHSYFHPTRLSVMPWSWAEQNKMKDHARTFLESMASVQFLSLYSFEIYGADLIPTLKFLRQLPQSITHLSS